VPITLVGFSGGGQMAAEQRFAAGVDWGFGNINILKLEHLYHLVGDKDG